ncbi:MAG: FtsH protease activity modulator HflK [Thermodesulfobacteriota bacterium]
MDQFRPRGDRMPTRDIQQGVEELKRLLDGFSGGWVFWVVLLVVGLLYLSTGIYKVGPGDKGVVLLFGKLSAVSEPGLRYRLPKPFMTHFIVNVSEVRRAEIGFRSDGSRQRPVQAESLMLTGDHNIVDVQFFVQYKVHDPIKFIFGCDKPEQALRASCEVALRGVVGERGIDYTMTDGRERVQEDVREYLQKLLDAYNTGLYVTQARLQAVDPPEEVKEAFHDVVRALEDRERLIKEAEGYEADILPRARGQAQQEIQQAEAYKAQREIRARGDAGRFERVLAEYARFPAVTRERLYLESAEKFLQNTKKVIMESGDSKVLPLLPILGDQKADPIPLPGTTPKGR